jgi:uncharacterized membrane protein YphA (DoxX/SURF4 family)
MKSLLANGYLVLLTRIFIGTMFVVASVDKIADANAFAVSIANYKLSPDALSMTVATVMPWVELISGLGILFGVVLRGSSLLAALMLVVFTAGVISALLRGLDISCGCFTQDPQVGKVSWLKVAQNTGALLLTLFLFYSNSAKFTLEEYLRGTRPEDVGESAP